MVGFGDACVLGWGWLRYGFGFDGLIAVFGGLVVWLGFVAWFNLWLGGFIRVGLCVL